MGAGRKSPRQLGGRFFILFHFSCCCYCLFRMMNGCFVLGLIGWMLKSCLGMGQNSIGPDTLFVMRFNYSYCSHFPGKQKKIKKIPAIG